MKIGIIGLGRMGTALIHSWQARSQSQSKPMSISPAMTTSMSPAMIKPMKKGKSLDDSGPPKELFAVQRKGQPECPEIGEYVKNIAILEDKADIIILAVKPQQLAAVCAELSGSKRYISIAAGISVETLGNWIGEDRTQPTIVKRICRVMPNLAAAVNAGIHTVYSENREMFQIAERLFSCSGIVTRIEDEKDFHIHTVVYACLPAFLLEFVNEIGELAQKNYQLDAQQWHRLLPQVLKGLHRLLIHEEIGQASNLPNPPNPSTELPKLPKLIKAIASPGGVTEAGLQGLRKHDLLKKIAADILQTSCQRSHDLDQSAFHFKKTK